jgi:hypothetical protein
LPELRHSTMTNDKRTINNEQRTGLMDWEINDSLDGDSLCLHFVT